MTSSSKYEVLLAASARKSFERADKSLQQRMQRCFDQLAIEPRRHPNIKPLKGELAGYWRYRVGNYRVIYRIEDNRQVVIVLMIVHRGKAYE